MAAARGQHPSMLVHALALFHGLEGELMPVYGCRFEAMWALRERMGPENGDVV